MEELNKYLAWTLFIFGYVLPAGLILTALTREAWELDQVTISRMIQIIIIAGFPLTNLIILYQISESILTQDYIPGFKWFSRIMDVHLVRNNKSRLYELD